MKVFPSQIFIESLRDLKKGGTKETLDIKISDTAGIRPYEMFSGGEAFRIDFALRIAISKLLARRAGTSLQTLIIDEGFGSQDEEGLTHIMDAMHKIQDDFAKIIVVSHLASLKEQFYLNQMANQIEVRFGLSTDRAKEIATVAHQFNTLAGTRELTEKDANVFAVSVIGKNLKDVEAAVKSSMQGDSASLNAMLQEIATHNNTSPEKVNTIISEIFF